MSEEYNALRAEMLAWQNRRFMILTASVSLVTGILGIDGVTDAGSDLGWGLVSSLLWFFLGSAAALTWYAGRANAKIAAYFIVFHEVESEGWETRLKKLKADGLDRFNLNRMVLLIYVGLGVLSFLIPWSVRGYQCPSAWHAVVLVVSGVWLGFSLWLLLLPLPRGLYEQKWRDLGRV